MKQDDVDKARLQESKRKRQEIVSGHLVSDKVKHARIELDDGGKTQGGVGIRRATRTVDIRFVIER